MHSSDNLITLMDSVRRCNVCENLPLGPKPIVQATSSAKILIAGQAPGRITHTKGIPFDDPSGDRLRSWMGIDRETFYDAAKIAILPMGFCFPGTGKSGDLPPREECAAKWRDQLLAQLRDIELTLIIGRYAIDWHLTSYKNESITNIVSKWRESWPTTLPMPHPSPRNNRWLKNNAWFETEVIPLLQKRVATLVLE